MNRTMISKMKWTRIKLRPIARRVDDAGLDLEQIDDAWMLQTATKEQINFQNPRTGHVLVIGTDHVREYMTDFTGQTGGFMILKSQISLSRRGVFVEPILELRSAH
jgi:hypothetical protein